MKETFHFESIEYPVELQISYLGVSGIQQTSDDFQPLRTNFEGVQRGVVLHLYTGFIGYPIASTLA